MAWGLFIFSISAAGCGFMGILTKRQKWGYYVFMIFRFFVGLGEAATISLGFTIVDELSPPAYKTLYMAALMMAPPFGIAIGYVYSHLANSTVTVLLGFWSQNRGKISSLEKHSLCLFVQYYVILYLCTITQNLQLIRMNKSLKKTLPFP
jgi:MFS family permease